MTRTMMMNENVIYSRTPATSSSQSSPANFAPILCNQPLLPTHLLQVVLSIHLFQLLLPTHLLQVVLRIHLLPLLLLTQPGTICSHKPPTAHPPPVTSAPHTTLATTASRPPPEICSSHNSCNFISSHISAPSASCPSPATSTRHATPASSANH
jgi:hypothetical protein